MNNKKDDKFLNLLKDLIVSVVVSFVIVIIITQFLVRPVRVDGLSMYPTLNDEEIGFSNILGLRLGDLKRSDIVVVHIEDRNRYIVKRIVGMPGDKVEARKGVVYINDEPYIESYLDTDYVHDWERDGDTYFTSDFGPITVPDDAYFLLGDNRQHSTDSRVYGSFSKDLIKSKGVFVIFPLSELRNAGG